jgi:AbrB family looped-hinge helix DNA binding protein
MTVRIDRAGRIVVPKAIRERLGLEPGTKLEISESSDGFLAYRAGVPRKGNLLVHPGRAYDKEAAQLERHARIREFRLP